MSLRRALCALLVAAAPGVSAAQAAAAPGDLDPSFGTAGASAPLPGSVADVVLEPRGAALVLATHERAAGAPREVSLTRVTSSGAVDPAFGTDGSAVLPLAPGRDAYALAVTRGFGGRLLVAAAVAASSGSVPRRELVVARLLADGRLDRAFGAGGTRTVPVPGEGEYLSFGALDVRPDGSVLVATTRSLQIATARLTWGGALDRRHGGSGVVAFDLVEVVPDVAVGPTSLTFDAGGRLLVPCSAAGSRAVVVRAGRDGRPDPAWGAGGAARTGPQGDYLSPNALTTAPDGGVLLAAGAVAPSEEWDSALARFGPGGAPGGPDADGWLFHQDLALPDALPPRHDLLKDVATLPDGRAVAAGYVARPTPDLGLLAARARPDGTLDPAFGDDGVVRGEVEGTGQAVLVAADGAVLVAVERRAAGQDASTWQLVRLQGDTADLRLTTVGAPVRAGGRVTVRLRLTNAGPHPAPAATLTLTRPPAVGGGTTSDRVETDLAPGQSVTTTVELAVPAGTGGTLVAHARAVARDPTPYDARVRIALPG